MPTSMRQKAQRTMRLLAFGGHSVTSPRSTAVLTALSGEEGVEICKEQPPDAVIRGLGIPGMSEWDVRKRISAIGRDRGFPKSPIMLLTAWGSGGGEGEDGPERRGCRRRQAAEDSVHPRSHPGVCRKGTVKRFRRMNHAGDVKTKGTRPLFLGPPRPCVPLGIPKLFSR